MNRCTALCLLLFLMMLSPFPSCGKRGSGTARQKVIIFHAGSLSLPFEAMEKAFEAMHPEIDIERESAGSVACARKIADLGKPCDIMASSDYAVIDRILIPRFANWNVRFATNRIVLAYTDKSRYAGTINPNNWYEILQKKDVVWGYSDPDLDPCGYRSLMVLQLAELHYGKPGLSGRLMASCPNENVRPKEVELVSLLQSGNMDYAWEYLSLAKQHRLHYLDLPEEINLGNYRFEQFYGKAKVMTAAEKPGIKSAVKGSSITYGATIPANAPNRSGAITFMRYLLDPEGGLKILAGMGQPPFIPARVPSPEMKNSMPGELAVLVEAKD